MTKKLVGLFASVALLSSGLAMAHDEKQKGQQTQQSGQQMGSEAYGGAGQGQMGGAQGQMGEKQVTGTVVKSGKDKLSLNTPGGIMEFQVDKQTQFEGADVKNLKDIKEGQQLRTSFDILNNKNVAKKISLDTGAGGSGLDQDINKDMGGSGLDQDINKDKDMGGDVGGSGDQSGKTY
jgi:Cu/Ag efflux protein CusF